MLTSCGANIPADYWFFQTMKKLILTPNKATRISKIVLRLSDWKFFVKNINHGITKNNCKSQAGYQPQK